MLVWGCILAGCETFWKTEAENKDMALLAWVADFGGEEDGAVLGFADKEEEGAVDDEIGGW